MNVCVYENSVIFQLKKLRKKTVKKLVKKLRKKTS